MARILLCAPRDAFPDREGALTMPRNLPFTSDTMPWTLNLWREVSRHQELPEFLEAILPVVSARLPVSGIVVYDAHPDRAVLDVLASEGSPRLIANWLHRYELDSKERRAISAWANAASTRDDAGPPPVHHLRSGLEEGHRAWFAPLMTGTQCIGILALVLEDDVEMDEGAVRALVEPFSTALVNHHRIDELRKLREALEADRQALLSRLERSDISEVVVGAERGLALVMERVLQVANTHAPVLLLGETGSGKEVIARTVHNQSDRSTGPMLRVNCGAIPSELVDAELFGHEKGSFSGAVGQRRGWFERAHGGTLFLDEIGELPAAAQVRLLRVLQDGVFERVGGEKTISVDVRIIAATHRDLPTMVDQGRFREDLWFRLSVFPIRIPTLRDRLEDIGDLASYFAARAGRRLGGLPLQVSSDDVDLLRNYPWPGNVRELAAVIERAAILGNGRSLAIKAAMGMHERRQEDRSDAYPAAAARSASPSAAASLEGAMRDHITSVLKKAGGRIEGPGGAADLLAINPHTLRSRMRKLGIDWSEFRTN